MFKSQILNIGLVERMKKTLLKRTRYILSYSILDKRYWIKVVNTTCFSINCSLSRIIDFKTLNKVL